MPVVEAAVLLLVEPEAPLVVGLLVAEQVAALAEPQVEQAVTPAEEVGAAADAEVLALILSVLIDPHRAPRLRVRCRRSLSSCEHFVRPALVHVLNGKVRLVGTIIVIAGSEAILQRLQAGDPLGPLRLTGL